MHSKPHNRGNIGQNPFILGAILRTLRLKIKNGNIGKKINDN